MIKIGIDPGVKTGVCIAENGKATRIFTTDFWGAYETAIALVRDEGKHLSDIEIHIEDTNDLPVLHRGVNQNAQAKIGRNVGGVCKESELLISGFRHKGFLVVVRDKKKFSKLNSKDFNRIFKHQNRTNQHERDAAVIVLDPVNRI